MVIRMDQVKQLAEGASISYQRYGVKIGSTPTLKDAALIMHNLTESDIVYMLKKILELNGLLLGALGSVTNNIIALRKVEVTLGSFCVTVGTHFVADPRLLFPELNFHGNDIIHTHSYIILTCLI